MYVDTGGAVVLLLIVRNFQRDSSSGITAKFVRLLNFLFGDYERLFDADYGRLMYDHLISPADQSQ
jgi:hypothetical protein